MKNYIKTLVLGILAGIAIGLGGTFFLLCKLENMTILGSFLFSTGLLLICSFGLNLYTGKIGYLSDNLNKNYVITLVMIYLGNIIGSNIYGLLLNLISNDTFIQLGKLVTASKLINLGNGGKTWGALFIGGVFCGMLVYLAVEGFKKENIPCFARVLILILCVGLFVYAGFEHCIADMFYFAFSGAIFSSNFGRVILSIAIITIGNSLGSIILHGLITIGKKEVLDAKNSK